LLILFAYKIAWFLYLASNSSLLLSEIINLVGGIKRI
jgi:hypothetical protein